MTGNKNVEAFRMLLGGIFIACILAYMLLSLASLSYKRKLIRNNPNGAGLILESLQRDLNHMTGYLSALTILFYFPAFILYQLNVSARESFVLLGMALGVHVANSAWEIWIYYRKLIRAGSHDHRAIGIKLAAFSLFMNAGLLLLACGSFFTVTIADNVRYILR